MVISRLDVDKIERRLSLIQALLGELKTLSEIPKEDFLSDNRNPAAAESYLRRAIECIFDIGRHILAKSYGLKELEYKKIARTLGEKGVVSREYAVILLKIAGYRNRMVHMYYEISPAEMYDVVASNLSDLDAFIGQIVRFLEDYNKSRTA